MKKERDFVHKKHKFVDVVTQHDKPELSEADLEKENQFNALQNQFLNGEIVDPTTISERLGSCYSFHSNSDYWNLWRNLLLNNPKFKPSSTVLNKIGIPAGETKQILSEIEKKYESHNSQEMFAKFSILRPKNKDKLEKPRNVQNCMNNLLNI